MARSQKSTVTVDEKMENEKKKSHGVSDNVLGLIGKTPMVKLQKVAPAGSSILYAKLEMLNPAGSVKDRIALAMIEEEGCCDYQAKYFHGCFLQRCNGCFSSRGTVWPGWWCIGSSGGECCCYHECNEAFEI